MTLTTIKTFKRADGLVKAVVKFCDDYQEYQVLLYKAGKLNKGATYHTDDKQDAFGTATLMCK